MPTDAVTKINGFAVPVALPPETQRLLVKACQLSACRDQDLVDLAVQFKGGDAAIGDRYLPRVEGYDWYEWQDLKRRLMLPVNLPRAITRRLRSAVLSNVRRTIVKNPYEKQMKAFISGAFPALMRQRLQNCILFGTGATGLTLEANGKRVGLWLPNPVNMHVIPGDSAYDPAAVVEFCDEGKTVRFCTKHATGVLRKGRDTAFGPDTQAAVVAGPSFVLFSEQDAGFGFLPANIGYGEDLRPMGEIHGGSIVRDSVKAGIRATDIMFNAGLLGKIQTRALLVIKKALDQGTLDMDLLKQGILTVEADGDAHYAIPDSKIGDMTALVDKVVEIVSLVVGVPTYDLSPGRFQQESAESARRQQVSLTTQVQELVEAVILDEQDIVLRATAMLRYAEKGKPVDLEALADEVETRIEIEPMIDPESSLEQANTDLLLWRSGIKDSEDIARRYNRKPDDEISRIAARMDSLRNTQAQPAATTPPLNKPQNQPTKEASA